LDSLFQIHMDSVTHVLCKRNLIMIESFKLLLDIVYLQSCGTHLAINMLCSISSFKVNNDSTEIIKTRYRNDFNSVILYYYKGFFIYT
jgi:hypothetical protein